jgi:hypothetical protein
MADNVVQRLSEPGTVQTRSDRFSNSFTPFIQTKCTSCEEEDKLQKKEENEGLPEGSLQLKPIFESDVPLPEDEIQRKCADCAEEEKLQKKEEDSDLPSGYGSGTVEEIPDLSAASDGGLQKPTGDFHQQLNASKGGGSPLDPESRETMGTQFGADFSGVRIHTGSQASEMNKGLKSQAFTHKNDIYFNEGKFNPSTTSGKHLLAHELTHTIQQGSSRPGIQKSNDKPTEAGEIDPTKLPLKDGQMNSAKTEITFDSVPIPDFKLKDHRKTLYDAAKPLKRMKGYNTDLRPSYEQYNQNWLKGIDNKTIKGILKDKLGPEFEDDEKPYVFKSTLSRSKETNPYYFGKLDDIVNQLKKPVWGGSSTNPRYVRMTLDHIVELQLANWDADKESNKESNLELLEEKVNSESGNIIKNNIDERVNRFNKATGNQLTGGLTGQQAQQEIKNKYTLVFNDPVRSNKGRRNLKAEEFWTLDQIEKGEHLNAVKAAHINELEEEGTVRIFPKPGARPKTFKWAPGMEEKIGSEEKNWFGKFILITRKEFDTTGTGEELGRFRVNADPAFLKKYHLVYSGKDIEIPIKRLDGSPSVGAVEKASASQVLLDWFKSMSFKPMSPIQVDHIDFNDLGEIEAQGIIKADLPFIKGTEINFKVENGDIQIYKEFTGPEFHMPSPFKLNRTSLLIFVDSGKGVGINGSVDFGIEKFGEGQISAMLTPSQLSFAGKFNFESDAFEPAYVMMSYVKEFGDGQGDNGKEPEWEISGKIGLKKQVKGIKEAVLEVKYANNTIEGLGNVELDIPAIEGGELHAVYDTTTKDFSITAELQLRKDIPGINGGCIGVTVSREGATGEYALGIVGSAQPDIPGLQNANLCISYQNGVFTIQGEAGFEKGIASGKVKLGVTNRPVGENGQPGEGTSNKLTAYGSGSLTVKFSEFLQGTVGATVTPEGRVILVGEIKIPDRISLTGEPVKFNEEIIKFPTISIPIIGVSALGKTVGIAAKIGGGVNAYATLGPFG